MEQAALGIASEVDAGDASPGLQQRLEIAQGLGVGERAEAEALAWDVEVGVVRGDELEEEAGVGSALVELSGGV